MKLFNEGNKEVRGMHKYGQVGSGKAVHPTPVMDEDNSWLWIKQGYLKKETEGLIMAAQDQAIRTN